MHKHTCTHNQIKGLIPSSSIILYFKNRIREGGLEQDTHLPKGQGGDKQPSVGLQVAMAILGLHGVWVINALGLW